MASLATAAAVVVAIGAVAFDLWRTRRERRERRASQERADAELVLREARDVRRQAEHVVAWSDVEIHYDDETRGVIPVGGTQTLWVHNASDAPVYDLAVTHQWFWARRDDVVFTRAVLVPTPVPVQLTRHVTIPDEEGPPAADGSTLRVVTFRDSGGRWWRRDVVGDLRQLDGRPNYDGVTVTPAPST